MKTAIAPQDYEISPTDAISTLAQSYLSYIHTYNYISFHLSLQIGTEHLRPKCHFQALVTPTAMDKQPSASETETVQVFALVLGPTKVSER